MSPEHISAFAPKVAAGDFARVNALVIGGSRGLGAAASKILALGGAKVALTFALGRSRRGRRGGRNRGGDRAPSGTRRFDMSRDEFSSLADADRSGERRIHVRHAEDPPRQAEGPRPESVRNVLRGICREAVGAVLVHRGAAPRQEDRLRAFVDFRRSRVQRLPRVRDGEAAAEALAADVNASFRYVRVVATRLPQLKTDQTASRFEVGYGSTFDTLYGVLNTVAAES